MVNVLVASSHVPNPAGTVEAGPTEGLFREPLHPYTQALLSAIPVPDPDTKMSRILLPGDVPSPANPPSGCRFHPRCPKAFESCGWAPEEVVEALDAAFREETAKGAKEPNAVERVEIEGEVEIRLILLGPQGPAVLPFVQRVIAEKAERLRGLKAIAAVGARGATEVRVRLHRGSVPVLRAVRKDHIVACHLYTEDHAGGVPPAPG